MSDRTKIEWTRSDDGTPGATWNPVTGCTKLSPSSPGCQNCYAATFAERFRGTPGHYFERGFDVQLRPEKLDQPLRWTRPRRIFVNSMSDLFHDQVPDKYIARVFAVMCHASHHTFQVLTKRHARMRSLLSSDAFRELVFTSTELDPRSPDGTSDVLTDYWPLPNVWLGVSTENQQWANTRIPALLATPAAVRFISAEPLLGPIDLTPCNCRGDQTSGCARHNFGSLTDVQREARALHFPGIDWVIVGGESGPGARPMHPDWARGLRDQCVAAGVPFLFKQWGEWAPVSWYGQGGATHAFTGGLYQDEAGAWVENFMQIGHNPTSGERDRETPPGAQGMRRVGKTFAGRELDGRTFDEYPAVANG